MFGNDWTVKRQLWNSSSQKFSLTWKDAVYSLPCSVFIYLLRSVSVTFLNHPQIMYLVIWIRIPSSFKFILKFFLFLRILYSYIVKYNHIYFSFPNPDTLYPCYILSSKFHLLFDLVLDMYNWYCPYVQRYGVINKNKSILPGDIPSIMNQFSLTQQLPAT